MKFFEAIGSSINKAVDYVVDKNHKAALVNRIRVVIKNERENASRAYVALGKYYFENLRDENNEETEHLCKAVEESTHRMERAFNKLDEITSPDIDDDDCWDECADCEGDCSACRGEDSDGDEDIIDFMKHTDCPVCKSCFTEEDETDAAPAAEDFPFLHRVEDVQPQAEESASAPEEKEEAADDDQ